MSDEELVKKIIKGDRKAMDELVDRYYKKIYNYFYRNTRNEDLSYEYTQEVFYKIFSKINSFDFKYKFSTWIYSISHNYLIDSIRKKKARSFSDSSSDELYFDERFNVNSLQKSTEEEVIYKEYIEKLWKVVSLLPPEYKELIIMRYVNEMKYEEMAEILEIPMGTLKNKLFRAKAKLLELWKKYDG